MAGMQYVACLDLQGVVLDACHRAARSHLITPSVPALPRRVLLKCGSYTAAAQLRIDAERLDEAFPERRVPLCLTAGLPSSAPITWIR